MDAMTLLDTQPVSQELINGLVQQELIAQRVSQLQGWYGEWSSIRELQDTVRVTSILTAWGFVGQA